MLTIKITEQIKQEAWFLADNITKTGITNSESSTGIGNTRENYYHGYLGELVFRDYLKFTGAKFAYKPVAGEADHGDFTLYTAGGGIVFADTKVASQDSHQYLMVPQKQFYRAQYNYYIGEKMTGNDIIICGYCEPFELREKMVKIVTMLKKLDELHDIDELLKLLRYDK